MIHAMHPWHVHQSACLLTACCLLAGCAEPNLKPDWTHVFLSVLPPLPLGQPRDETRITLALRAACAGIMSK